MRAAKGFYSNLFSVHSACSNKKGIYGNRSLISTLTKTEGNNAARTHNANSQAFIHSPLCPINFHLNPKHLLINTDSLCCTHCCFLPAFMNDEGVNMRGGWKMKEKSNFPLAFPSSSWSLMI